MKTCPHCQRLLEEVAVGGLRVDGCSGCGGLWFDAKELTQLAQHHREEMSGLEGRFRALGVSATPGKERCCPNCRLPLFPFEFPQARGVRLDGCRQCRGIWLDDGELAAIQERLQGGPTPSPADSAESSTVSTEPAPDESAVPPAAEIPAPRERRADTPGPPSPPAKERIEAAVSFLTRTPCPHCGEQNLEAEAVCWACGKSLQGQPTPQRARSARRARRSTPGWLPGVVALLALGIALFFGVRAFVGPRLPAPRGRINDFAHVLDPLNEQQLLALSQELEQKTRAELAVVTIPSLRGQSIERYARRLFNQWGIGKRGTDNGVLLLLAIQDRKLRVEVGRGLETTLPDSWCQQLIDGTIVPYLKAGQYGDGCAAGARQIAQQVAASQGQVMAQANFGPSHQTPGTAFPPGMMKGMPLTMGGEGAGYGPPGRSGGGYGNPLYGSHYTYGSRRTHWGRYHDGTGLLLFLVFLIIWLIRYWAYDRHRPYWWHSHYGGFGGGGGGFGGGGFGGGSSGGGGASGGW
jgi:uncharacterized protein